MDKYLKPPLTLAEGVEWLRKHNVVIEERERLEVERFLKAETTFRLMGIARAQKEKLPFEDLKKIYFFDRQLRNVFLEAFELTEVQLRNSVVNLLMEEPKAGAFIYENPEVFDPRFRPGHQAWLEELWEKIDRRSQEGFVSYYKERYKDDFPRLPMWAMVELLNFSELVSFCYNLSLFNRAKLAHNYCLDGHVLLNWLSNYSDVRNLCAHHRVLYNRVLNRAHKPLAKGWGEVAGDRIGVVLISLSKFLSSGCGIKDRNKDFLYCWHDRVNKLFDKNSDTTALMAGYGLSCETRV